MRFMVCTALGFAVVAFAAMASAQNLITNPDFDTGISGWTVQNGSGGSGFSVWDNDSGSPTGGGARVRFADTGSGGTTQGFSQCVTTVPASLPWVFGGRFAIVADVETGGPNVRQVLASAYSTNNCTAPPVNMQSSATGGVPVGVIDGSFALYMQHEGMFAVDPMPNGSPTQSIRIFALVQTDSNGDVSEVIWDKIYLGPAGTTPVELLGAGVD